MNKRMYERIDVSDELIPVKVTANGEDFILGTLKDISKVGISFNSYQEDLMLTFGKRVHVSFVYKEKFFQFDLELLRETQRPFSNLVAGKFVGIQSLIRREVLNLMIAAKERELILV